MYVFEGGGAVRNEKVFEIEAARNTLHFQLHEPNLNRELDRELPDAPVMSDTLLMLELAVRERVVDLSEVTQLVLGDLGAAIQIMRLAGREGLSGRMENCISGLGVQACLDAVARRPIKRGTCDPAIASRSRAPARRKRDEPFGSLQQLARIVAVRTRITPRPRSGRALLTTPGLNEDAAVNGIFQWCLAILIAHDVWRLDKVIE